MKDSYDLACDYTEAMEKEIARLSTLFVHAVLTKPLTDPADFADMTAVWSDPRRPPFRVIGKRKKTIAEVMEESLQYGDKGWPTMADALACMVHCNSSKSLALITKMASVWAENNARVES